MNVKCSNFLSIVERDGQYDYGALETHVVQLILGTASAMIS